MDASVENAIELAFNPGTDQELKAQAYTFIDQLRQDHNGWQVCLNLFTRAQAPSEVVRLVCLEVVNNAVQYQRLESSSLNYIRESLMNYVRHRYSAESAEIDSPPTQNKLTQTLTYLFTSLYISEWTSFFSDFRSFTGTFSDGTFNSAAAMLYLRVIGSIHDEIADVMIPRTPDEQKRCSDLKDLIRARDLSNIAAAWQEILSRWQQMDLALVEMCLRTVAKWVSWIDISVVIDGAIQNALLELAGQQRHPDSGSKEANVRDAAIDTFTETIGKKMSASDKIELIRYLNVVEIVGRLIESPALLALQKTPHYDTDLAEAVAKLVNNIVYDVVKVLDVATANTPTLESAGELLRSVVPYLLRFFADEYDEICSAVIPSLTDLLTMFRKRVKSRGCLPPEQADMVRPILDAIIAKMKYDDTATWGEEGEATDEAEFQELRKRLYVLQQTIAVIDERLYIESLSSVIKSTFSSLSSDHGSKPSWRDLDLALHELFLFGDLTTKSGGLYQKDAPASEAAQCLLDMVRQMVECGLASHPHPAVQIQYLEICVRYVQFFEHNPNDIPSTLRTFVNYVHSDTSKVRLRSWYLFHRFVKHLRRQLGNVAQDVVQAIGDLLKIKAEITENKDDDEMSSEDNGQSADATFTSQLYLFEAIGCVASTAVTPLETRVAIANSVVSPLCADIQQHLSAAQSGDERATLQISQVIMALGTLANGFSDWSPGSASGAPPPNRVSDEFVVASEATLTALETLRISSDIRTAARHTFSRTLGVLGSKIFPQLPRWIDGLLSSASSNDEMAMFLRTLAQLVYGFKSEIFEILDRLLTPLLQQVYAGLAQPTAGTDDEIQMKELRREYLNFLLVILNNELAPVLVTPTNQATFDSFITTITRFSIDVSDPQSARQAFSILSHIIELWGGANVSPDYAGELAPALPGFDSFMLSRFTTLPWTLLSAPSFNARDAQMRSVVQEAALLQWTILRKIGARYQSQLQNELSSLGVSEEGSLEFFRNITSDQAAFRKFFTAFAQQANVK